MNVRAYIRKILPLKAVLPVFNLWQAISWRFRGIEVSGGARCFRIRKGRKELRLSRRHSIYLSDTLENFDFYFDGVVPVEIDGREVVDYSLPGWHEAKGFALFPVFFNAVAEPIVSTRQYVEFAALTNGCVAIDLGAYSALTSIIFDQEVGADGQVVALEPDSGNFEACQKNLDLYKRLFDRHIPLMNVAIWNHDRGVLFSSEGSMGSSVASVVGADRVKPILVKTITLAGLAEKCNLTRVDFIKCDIEGGETEIFDAPEFFAKFRPKIVIECHMVNGASTADKCIAVLQRFGYTVELKAQDGYPLPLLFCAPAPI